MNNAHAISRTHNPVPASRGMTLIEVLMAVLVLAIGLLGLASVLPAVLKQQRDSADITMGAIAADSAEAFLRSAPSAPSYSGTPAAPKPWTLDARFFSIMLDPTIDPDTGKQWDPAPDGDQARTTFVPFDGRWFVPNVGGAPTGPNQTQIGVRGVLRQQLPNSAGTRVLAEPVFISLSDRLYPNDASGARQPQLVWDFAIKRVAPALSNADPLPLADRPNGFNRAMIAVFARPIDPRIRIARTQTLMRNMTDNLLGPPEQKNPVSVDSNFNPTFDGRSEDGYQYSQIRTAVAEFVPLVSPFSGEEIRDIIVIADLPEVVQMIGQPGQQIVDNLGNIYTVVGPPDPFLNTIGIKVTPPVPAGVFGAGGGGGGGPNNNGAPPPRITQILYTPQIPAAVRVFEVKP